MRHPALILFATASGLSGCASAPHQPLVGHASSGPPPVLQPAVLEPEPAKPALPPTEVSPSPAGQALKLQPVAFRQAPEPKDPAVRVASANAAARVQPSRDAYLNAVQVYPWSDGALYQVYTAPGEVTDIMLEPGEALAETGPVAAGDTVRWVIGDTVSGAGAARRVHILVKPTHVALATNLVINTDRRTYHLELRATERTYMASVSWRYPQDALIAVRDGTATPGAAAPAGPELSLDSLDFGYRIEGDKPSWRPVRAFDDGRRVIIEFPDGVAQGEMPPLFVLGPKGKEAELVNYRVQGRRMVIDRLFAVAELRIGGKSGQQRVRIVSTGKTRGSSQETGQ